jgi:predicted DNA-binding antitoxin AbrB/MazE fold protein
MQSAAEPITSGEPAMLITVEAVYENGVLKLERPLPLKDQQKVRVTIQPELTLAEQTAGLLGWKGDAETLERVLAEAEEAEELP